jgi:hypothetical protein
MKKICALYIPCEGEIKLLEISDDIEEKQKFVGGVVGHVSVSAENPFLIVINQKAKEEKKALNIRGTCIANNFCKVTNQFFRDVAVFGDVLVEGCFYNQELIEYESCSLPINYLEEIIELCNRADIWWNSVGKKIANSPYIKWLTKPQNIEDDF